jgi:exosortase K
MNQADKLADPSPSGRKADTPPSMGGRSANASPSGRKADTPPSMGGRSARGLTLFPYLLALIAALCLKSHYSTADSEALLWILEPTARLTALLTGLEFTFRPSEGFVDATGRIVIAPACAGLNFLTICFCLLAFSHLHRFRRTPARLGWVVASGLLALLCALPVNTARIVWAIDSYSRPLAEGVLSPERLHRWEGICLYFLALSLLYTVSEVLIAHLTRRAPGNTDRNAYDRPATAAPTFERHAPTNPDCSPTSQMPTPRAFVPPETRPGPTVREAFPSPATAPIAPDSFGQASITLPSPGHPASSLESLSPTFFLVPWFWYLAITLGLPLARGSFAGNTAHIIEHTLTVILLPLFLLLTLHLLMKLGRRLISASRREWAGLVLAVVIIGGIFHAWNPGPATAISFDKSQNGLWAESKWYTGFDGETGKPVGAADIEALADRLNTHGITYVYVRAGRFSPTGRVEHLPGPVFFQLQKRFPQVTFLPWLSGHSSDLPINDTQWRSQAIAELGKLSSLGVKGVHLDIEPIHDHHPGYLELLREIRSRFDGAFFVSHASCRVAPFDALGGPAGRYCWSEAFYRAVMGATDQTVLMGYNTALPSPKLYQGYLRRQTRQLLSWAAEIPRHSLLIGIPSYDRVPFLFDPTVENVETAARGVRAALEGFLVVPPCFNGIALYADWTTTPEEWRQLAATWGSGVSVP